jgi:tetratricopeptide (TPR) repeat protein
MTRLLSVALVFAVVVPLTSLGCNGPNSMGMGRDGSRRGIGRFARNGRSPEILPNTYLSAGRLLESSGQLEKAVEQYTSAIQEDPKLVEAHNRLGIVLGILGKHADAQAAMQQAVSLRPTSAALHNNLGFEFLSLRKWATAEQEFRTALKLDPGLAKARVNLGLSLVAQRKFDQAHDEYVRVLPAADAWYNMGLAYRAHRRYSDAAVAFRRALESNPGFVAAERQINALTKVKKISKDEPREQPGQQFDVLLAAGVVPLLSELEPNEGPDLMAALSRRWEQIRSELPVRAPEKQVHAFVGEAAPAVHHAVKPIENDLAPRSSTAGGRGDFDFDGDIDLRDFHRFHQCQSGANHGYAAGCAAADYDRDGDVDLMDYHLLQTRASKRRPSPDHRLSFLQRESLQRSESDDR